MADFTSHPGEPYGRWCYRKDPACGEPTADSKPTFCGQACWREASTRGLLPAAYMVREVGGLKLEDPDAARIAASPKVREAVRQLAPKVGGHLQSVTISSGGRSVTLTQGDRARMDAARRKGAR